MKSEAIRHIILLLLLACFSAELAVCQSEEAATYSYDFRGEPLERVLDTIARDAGLDLVYDPELVRGKEVYRRVTNNPVTQILRGVLADHGLDYLTLSTGTLVIIRRAAESPSYGALSGIIVDGNTGEPLPGATILFADAAGGTSTGHMGQFALNNMLSGEHTLIFSYVGYQAVTKKITIQPGRKIQETVQLEPRPVDISPIVVEAHRPQIYRLDANSGQTTSAGWYERRSSRPILDLSVIPGVRSGVPMAELSLQGGQESEHRLRLDGAPVYQTNSVGQLYSPFSPFAIETIEVRRAGYGVRHGSQIAGLIELNHGLPSGSQKGIALLADPVSINTKGDFSRDYGNGSSVAMMAAFRTNIWNVYKDPVLEQTLSDWDVIDPLVTNSVSETVNNAEQYLPFDHQSDISFYDGHFAVQYKPGSYNTFNASLYSSGNFLSTAVLNRSLPESDGEPYLYAAEEYNWDTRMARLNWRTLPSSRVSVSSQASYSASTFSHKNELGYGIPGVFLANSQSSLSSDSDGVGFELVELPASISANEIHHFVLASELIYSVSPLLDLEGGLQFDRVSTTLDANETTPASSFSDVKSAMLAMFLSSNIRFGRYWHLESGSRFTYTDGPNDVYAEPRVSLQIDRPESSIDYWSAKVSGGIYRQFVNEYRVSNNGATSVVPSFSVWSHTGSLRVPKAYHLTGSWYFEPSEYSTLRVEGYLKWQPVTAITSYRQRVETAGSQEESDIDIFAETTDMNASGIGIRYSRSLPVLNLSLLAGYDFSYARINMETQFGQRVTAPWNDPHRAQLRAVWGVSSDLSLLAKWQGIWGRRWAFRDAYYSYLNLSEAQQAASTDFSSPGDDGLPHFSQVDLSAIYRSDIRQVGVELRLDLINVLNRKNPVDHYLRPVIREGSVTDYETAERTLPGFYPSFSIRLSI